MGSSSSSDCRSGGPPVADRANRNRSTSVVNGAARQHPGMVSTSRDAVGTALRPCSALRACRAAHGGPTTRHLDACGTRCYVPACWLPETTVHAMATDGLAIGVRMRGGDWTIAATTAGSHMEADG